MKDAEIVQALERHWSRPEGFLAKLRDGSYDPAAFKLLESTLKSLDFSKSEVISRRAVALLWYMPLFMTWQRERVATKGGRVEELNAAIAAVENQMEKILGAP